GWGVCRLLHRRAGGRCKPQDVTVPGDETLQKRMALAVALVVNVLLVILLTPLGFETRPSADLKTVGYIAIGTIFAGLILDVASFALLFRRVRLASSLAIVGSIHLFFPIFGDQAGSFFSLPIPPVVHTLEYIFIPVLLVTLFLASKVYRDSRPSPI